MEFGVSGAVQSKLSQLLSQSFFRQGKLYWAFVFNINSINFMQQWLWADGAFGIPNLRKALLVVCNLTKDSYRKMKKTIALILVATLGIFSCNTGGKVAPETVDAKTSNLVEYIQNYKDLYTTYEYVDAKGGSLIVQNSFPRGGIKYTAPDGEDYYCAVFFTRLINETGNPLELKINFPADSFAFPSLPGRYFKLLLPFDTMTVDKASLPNYGLTGLDFFLDNNRLKPSSLERTIKPKESSGFYIVKFNIKPKSGWDGGSGSTRAEFILKEQNLYYRIENDGVKSNSKSSDIEMNCGSINLKNLILKK